MSQNRPDTHSLQVTVVVEPLVDSEHFKQFAGQSEINVKIFPCHIYLCLDSIRFAISYSQGGLGYFTSFLEGGGSPEHNETMNPIATNCWKTNTSIVYAGHNLTNTVPQLIGQNCCSYVR